MYLALDACERTPGCFQKICESATRDMASRHRFHRDSIEGRRINVSHRWYIVVGVGLDIDHQREQLTYNNEKSGEGRLAKHKEEDKTKTTGQGLSGTQKNRWIPEEHAAMTAADTCREKVVHVRHRPLPC